MRKIMTRKVSTVHVTFAISALAALIFSMHAASKAENANSEFTRILLQGCSPGDEKLINKLVMRLVQAEAEVKRLKSTSEESLSSEGESQVYFTTEGGGIFAYSPSTSIATKFRNSSENILGIGYDTGSDLIYWSNSKVYRAPAHASGANAADVILDDFKQYGWIWGLAFDWISGTIYGVTDRGFVIACNTAAEQVIKCATVLSGLGTIRGVALNPIVGLMYLTTHAGGRRVQLNRAIVRAGMDGTDATAIVSDLRTPCGIVYEFKSDRIYWADDTTTRIQSSDADGGNVQTMVTLPNGPLGLALYGNKIYFGYYWSDLVQSMNKSGADIRTVYTAAATNIRSFVVPDWNAPTNRTDHCLKHSCSNVCVLTVTSFRCLN